MGSIYELRLRRPARPPKGAFWVEGTDRCFASARAFSALDRSARVVKVMSRADAGVSVCVEYPSCLLDVPPDEISDDIVAMALAGGVRERDEVVVFLGRGVVTTGIENSFVYDGLGRRKYTWCFVPRDEFVAEERARRRACDFLASQMMRPDTRVALSFGAGAVRTVLHSLVTRLIQGLGLAQYVDEVWGTSAGSIAALMFASEVPAAEIEQRVFQVYRGEVDLKLVPPKPRDIYDGFLGPLYRKRPYWEMGLYDTKQKLDPLLPWFVGTRKRTKPLFCVAYNGSRFRREILTPDAMPELNYGIYEQITSVPVEDAIGASCCLPFVFRPRILERRSVACHFFDGALYEQLPMEAIYERFVADRRLGREKRERLFIISSNVFQPRLDFETAREQPLRIISGLMAQALLESQMRAQVARVASFENTQVLCFDFAASDYRQLHVDHIPTILREGRMDVIDSLLEYASQGEFDTEMQSGEVSASDEPLEAS